MVINLFRVKEKQANDTELYKANLDKVVSNLLGLQKVEELLSVFNYNLIPILERPCARRLKRTYAGSHTGHCRGKCGDIMYGGENGYV